MTVKKRGRPPGPAGMRRQALLNPPPYIQVRLTARGGKSDQRWIDVLKSMDTHMRLITAYRRKFRIKEEAALTIIASINEAVRQEDLDKALASVKGWKKVSDAGLRAKGYEEPRWHETVRRLMTQQYAKCSMRRVAQIVQELERNANRAVPHERSIRRFIESLRSGAHLLNKKY